MDVRPAAVAGLFYSDSPDELVRVVDAALTAGARTGALVPKAVVAPHAGYMYSGATAGRAFAAIAGAPIERVVLLGPAHRARVRGLALPAATALRTPLGDVRVDAELAARVRTLPFVEVSDAAHAREHSLEVELPFLQRSLGDFSVLPLCVGGATPEQVAAVLEAVWGGPETLIVVSSDLSHYHPDPVARRLDRATADAIVHLTDLHPDQACGAHAVNGLLHAAKRRGMRAEALDLTTSGDASGSHDQVVGYGAFAFYEGVSA